MLRHYFGRLWKLITGLILALMMMAGLDLMQNGHLGVTWDDAGFLAYAGLGMLALCCLFALDPGWFDRDE
jgi:flagellar motor component MotA